MRSETSPFLPRAARRTSSSAASSGAASMAVRYFSRRPVMSSKVSPSRRGRCLAQGKRDCKRRAASDQAGSSATISIGASGPARTHADPPEPARCRRAHQQVEADDRQALGGDALAHLARGLEHEGAPVASPSTRSRLPSSGR